MSPDDSFEKISEDTQQDVCSKEDRELLLNIENMKGGCNVPRDGSVNHDDYIYDVK